MRAAALFLAAAVAGGGTAPYAPGEILRYRVTLSHTQTVRGMARTSAEGSFLVDLVVTERLDGESVRLQGTCRPEGEPAQALLAFCPETVTLDAPSDPLTLPGIGPWAMFVLRPPAEIDPDDPEWGDEGSREDERGNEEWSLKFRPGEGEWIEASLAWKNEVVDSLFPRTTDLEVNAAYRMQGERVVEARALGVHDLLPFQVQDKLVVHLAMRPADEE